MDNNLYENDPEYRKFIETEQYLLQKQLSVSKLTHKCFPKCITTEKSMNTTEEICLTQCVGRYTDTLMTISKDINQRLQKK